MSKEIAKKPAAGLMKKLQGAAGKGNENVGQDDIIVPVLVLIQANSPQTIKKSDAYIEGCAAGDLINTLTREDYGDELIFIPVTYRRTFREHGARDKDGRLGEFVAEYDRYDMEKLEENDKGFRVIDPESGNEVVQTASDLALVLPGAKVDAKGNVKFSGDLDPIMIRSRFTKWRFAKALNSLAKRLTIDTPDGKVEAPRYAAYYKLKSDYIESADNPYYNYSVEFVGWCNEEHFTTADAFYNSISKKAVKTVGDDEAEEKF